MSDKLSQKDAVYEAVCTCRDEHGNFDRDEVANCLMDMYERGLWDIKSDGKKATDKDKRIYIGSIISNWVRKDSRLSSGVSSSTHEKRKPRPADDEMKRLMMAKILLLKENQSTDEIDELISQRSVEILTQRSQVKELAESKAKELLGI